MNHADGGDEWLDGGRDVGLRIGLGVVVVILLVVVIRNCRRNSAATGRGCITLHR